MFDLCKKVKIYHIENHYHFSDQTIREIHQTSEIQFEEQSVDLSQQLSADRLHSSASHFVNSRHRPGIDVSLRLNRSPSPRRKLSLTSSRKQLYKRKESHSNETVFQTIKSKMTTLSPLQLHTLVQSKLQRATPSSGQIISPKLAVYNENGEDISQTKYFPKELPSQKQPILVKQVTRATNESLTNGSMRSSDPRIQQSSPLLKKSQSFLRTSRDQSSGIREILNMRNSNNYGLREEISESLMKLSSSHYTSQIFGKGASEFSQSYSLELKRDEDCLGGIGRSVKESVMIPGKPKESIILQGRGMKVVRSNNDLLTGKDSLSQMELKPSSSFIIGSNYQSPVSKLKRKLTDNGHLNIYDKQTIVSKSINSGQKIEVIDESLVMQHELDSKFTQIPGRAINCAKYRIYLAAEQLTGMLLMIKQIPIDRIEGITSQLGVYREIEAAGLETDIARLYQVYTHGNILFLVKEPYEGLFRDFLDQHAQNYLLIGWEFLIRSLIDKIAQVIDLMKKRGLKLLRPVKIEDIVCIFGEWKLHSPDMFGFLQGNMKQYGAAQVLDLLEQEMTRRLGRTRQNNKQ